MECLRLLFCLCLWTYRYSNCTCTNPSPSNGGATCTGSTSQSCSTAACGVVVAQPGSSLPLDPNGWTVFTPSSDTRTIYISNSIGVDTNDGLSQSTPVKTITKGKSLLRNNYPDWLLLRKGDVWTDETIGNVCLSGRSATEPMLISAYGSGARPMMKTNPSVNSDGIYTSCNGSAGIGDYLAVVGLDFYSYTRDPNSPGFNLSTVATGGAGFSFLNPTNWLLLEDNKFSFYGGNTLQAYPSGTFKKVSLRRNIITDSYSTNSHSQGLFSYETSDFLLEENVWDHNGWNTQVPGAGSTIFNRNMYLSHGDGKTVVRGNIDANGASGGVQVRTGGIAENNLFLRDPISISFGSNENQAIEVSGAIRNNVTLDSHDIDTQLQGSSIWISSNNASSQGGQSFVNNLDVSGNIVAHNELGTGNIAAIRLEGDGPFSNTNVHDNIVYDWTRAAWPTAADHRADGFQIRVATSSINTFFQNNIIQQPRSGFIGLTSNNDLTPSGITIRNNTYWSAEVDPPTVWSKGWFEFNCCNAISWDEWMSRIGDTGAIKKLLNFVDPHRTIETYMASIGMTPTFDAFMSKARAQSKDTWDPRFTASAVNDYIRAGFVITP